MNQEYRGRVKRWLESGGDPKYVNVKKKAEKRMQDEVYKENLKGDFSRHPVTGAPMSKFHNKQSKTKAQVKAIKAKMKVNPVHLEFGKEAKVGKPRYETDKEYKRRTSEERAIERKQR